MSLLKDLTYILRMIKLAQLFARHDALFVFERLGMPRIITFFARPFRHKESQKLRPGQRLTAALQEAGSVYIKLGQQLSTRVDLLGEDICNDLRILQDDVPAFPFEQVKQSIEEEFQQPLDQLFKMFDPKPIAAASIAQVHYATTLEDVEVAVKVLRPGVREEAEKAFDMYLWAAQKAEKRKPQLKRFKPIETLNTFRRTMRLEMNLANEAAACDTFYRQFKDDTQFTAPKIHWRFTAENIITMDRVTAIRLSDKKAILAAGIDVNIIMKNAAYGLFKQAFMHGFFHADLHPGNLFVEPSGRLVAVDFGIVGYLSEDLRRLLAQFLISVLKKDWLKAAELHFDLGWVDRKHSAEELARVLGGVVGPIIDRPQDEISIGQLLARVIRATSFFQMEAQPELLLLQKALVAAEGTGRYLDPSVNLWMLSREPMEAWMHKNLGVQAQVKHISQEFVRDVKRVPRILKQLEKRLDETKENSSYQKQHQNKNNFMWMFMLLIISLNFISLIWLWKH